MLARSAGWLAAMVLIPITGAAARADLQTQQIATGLTAPLYLTQPEGDSRLFITERAGVVRVIDGSLQTTPYFDISASISTSGEGGLLGLAFRPDFATSGVLYVNYTAPSGGGLDTVIERITVSTPDQPTAGSLTRQTVFRFAQPQTNHNAGWIGFAPGDATGQYLYIPTGDGGGANDPSDFAQNLASVHGKVLRLDVSGGDDFPSDANRNYVIPGDNFFAADGDPNTRGEIIAFGLRNPFRDSFDRETGDLYLGDVGQATREEVSVLASGLQGQNFGWDIREGDVDNPGTPGTLDPEDRVDPIFDYARTNQGDGTPVLGGTIIGGYVYRGDLLGPGYEGLYIAGDFVSGRFFMIDPAAASVDQSLLEITSQLFPGGFSTFNLGSFGEDASGELYILTLGGQVYQIVPEPALGGALALSALILLRRRGHSSA